MTIAIIGAGAMGGSLAEGLLSIKSPSPQPRVEGVDRYRGASTTIIATL